MNSQLPSLSIFFPCYNDGGTIASMVLLALETARDLTADYEVIVIDDGSVDSSRDVLRQLQKDHPDHVRPVFHQKNQGYGGALRTGFATARKDWIFYTDGDAQYDVKEIRLLAEQVTDQVEWVQGWKIKRHDPIHRIIIGRVYHWTMKLMFGLKIRDVDCDFRLIRRSVMDEIHLTQNSGVICLEMVKKLEKRGTRCRQVGVNHFFRTYGSSQFFNFRRIAAVGRGVLRLWWRLVVRGDYSDRGAQRAAAEEVTS